MSKDEDADWDWYIHASEAEIAAEERRLNAEVAESEREFAKLPIDVQIKHMRRWTLQSIRANRRRLRDPQLNTIDYVTEMWRKGIRRGQRRLLELRAWRSTGIYPGHG